MRTGYVDETWAKEHHEYWYNDVKAGRTHGEGDAAACGAPCGVMVVRSTRSNGQLGGGRAAMKTIRALLAATFVVATFGLAVAKLPPPPPMTDAQKAARKRRKPRPPPRRKWQNNSKPRPKIASPRSISRHESQGQVRGAAADGGGDTGRRAAAPAKERRRAAKK